MTFDPAFLDLMPDSIVVYDGAPTRTVNGVESWAAVSASTYAARIVQQGSQVRRDDGSVREIRTVVWVAPTTTVLSTGSMVELPDGTRPPIGGVETYTDESGYHHTKLHMGWTARRA